MAKVYVLHPYVHDKQQDTKSVVSPFAQETRLVHHIAVYQNKKISEIEMLRDVRALITMCLDALHCPKTAEAITTISNHYLSQTKGNQKKSWENVQQTIPTHNTTFHHTRTK